MLNDSFLIESLLPSVVAMLGETPEGYAYWRDLSQARVAVSSAQAVSDPILLGVRHRVRERFGEFDAAAVRRLKDWLIEECGLSADQAETIRLDELLQQLRRGQRGDAPEPPKRLTLDDATQTVTLDGEQYLIENPKTYGIFKAIYEKYSPGNPVTNETIQRLVHGVRGKNAISNHLKKLPSALFKIIMTTTNGKSLCLPRLNKE